MKKRRRVRPERSKLNYLVGCEFVHRREKRKRIRIKMLAGKYFVVFGFHNGRNWTIGEDSLEKNYKLEHLAVRAKVGTGPLLIVTLKQTTRPKLGDHIKFNQILNGDFKGGVVDGLEESGGETFYKIERM